MHISVECASFEKVWLESCLEILEELTVAR